MPPADDGPSDDIIMPNSSDEGDEDDSSSISSKGESEQPEGSMVRKANTVIYDCIPAVFSKIFPGVISEDLFFTES